MKFVLNFLRLITVFIMIILVHYFFSYFLPSPFDHINIIFLAVIVSIIGWESGVSIWLSCLLYFSMELYSISPFGLILFPGALSIIFAYWLYVFIFTNRSWTSAVALTALSIIIYRILYTLLFVIIEYFDKGFHISWQALLFPYFWELILTSFSTGLVVFIFSKIWKRFKMDKAIL